MQPGKTKVIIGAGLVVLAVAGVVYLKLAPKPVEAKDPQAPAVEKLSPAGVARIPASAVAASSATGRAERAGQLVNRRIPAVKAATTALTADQAEAEKMEARLEDDDQTAALAIARTLMRSKDPEVRAQVVAALGWIGIKALPELSKMMADESDAVAADAFQQWKESIGDVADEALKSQILVAGMQSLTGQDQLESCVMEFNDLPDDLAVRGLVTIIQSSNPVASEVARDHYGFVTGGDYTTPADAEKWISENVEPPQPAAPVKK